MFVLSHHRKKCHSILMIKHALLGRRGVTHNKDASPYVSYSHAINNDSYNVLLFLTITMSYEGPRPSMGWQLQCVCFGKGMKFWALFGYHQNIFVLQNVLVGREFQIFMSMRGVVESLIPFEVSVVETKNG